MGRSIVSLDLCLVVIQIRNDCVVRLVCLFGEKQSVFITCTALWWTMSNAMTVFYRYVILVLNNCSFFFLGGNHLIAFQRSKFEMVTRYFIDLRRHLTNNEFEKLNLLFEWTMNPPFQSASDEIFRIFAFLKCYRIQVFYWINR